MRGPSTDTPDDLDLYGELAWAKGLDAAERRGVWGEGSRMALLSLACAATDYLNAAWLAKTQWPMWSAEDVELHRVEVRRLMVRCGLLPAELVACRPIRPDGLDEDVAALCGVPACDSEG